MCRRRDLTRERLGLAEGLDLLGHDVLVIPDMVPNGAPLRSILAAVGPVDGVLAVEAPRGWLPRDVTTAPVATGIFQIDTKTWLQRRARWSLLFDMVFVFHPGTEQDFVSAGNSNVHLLPHAFRGPALTDSKEHALRRFDVGFVGTTGGPQYQRRLRILRSLEACATMNDWRRRYQEHEALGVYRESRMVINIGRDWWPGDANIRCFEAMAAGALLVTYVPSELEELGFRDGIHFVGFRDEREVPSLVRRFLEDAHVRQLIASRGREEVLQRHTWLHRAAAVVRALSDAAGTRPATRMSRADVEAIYLDYCIAHRALGPAARAAAALGLRSPGHLLRSGRGILARRVRRCRSPWGEWGW